MFSLREDYKGNRFFFGGGGRAKKAIGVKMVYFVFVFLYLVVL